MQNQEMQFRNKVQQSIKTFDLHKAEITPSTLDENPGTYTAIHTGSEYRLNDKHISPIQEALQWPNTPKSIRHRENATYDNM
jgi:hypothetical protein